MPPTTGQFALSSSAATTQRNGLIHTHAVHTHPHQVQVQVAPPPHQQHLYGQQQQQQVQASYSNGDLSMGYGQPTAGPSHLTQPDDSRGTKDRRRREGSARTPRQELDRAEYVVYHSGETRIEGLTPLATPSAQRIHNERMSALILSGTQLYAEPSAHPEFMMRLLPKSIERAALLNQCQYEEAHGLENARLAWEEERDRVDSEWRKGNDRLKERLLEGIEERRRRAREEKDGEGVVDQAVDGGAGRPHVTRKLRNKLAASPPPSSNGANGATNDAGSGGRPVLNPHSLAVEELPSPFPLTLTDVALVSGNGGKRQKKTGAQMQSVGFGKAIQQLTALKDSEVDTDLGEIRRISKKRRTAAGGLRG